MQPPDNDTDKITDINVRRVVCKEHTLNIVSKNR